MYEAYASYTSLTHTRHKVGLAPAELVRRSAPSGGQRSRLSRLGGFGAFVDVHFDGDERSERCISFERHRSTDPSQCGPSRSYKTYFDALASVACSRGDADRRPGKSDGVEPPGPADLTLTYCPWEKDAITFFEAFIVTLHVLVPVQAPLHPRNLLPAAWAAVSVTTVPDA
jgi:hypothetical protein